SVASERTVTEGRRLAADALEVAGGDLEYVDGTFRVAGTDHRIELFELARRQPSQRIVVDSTSSVKDATWPNGCHICEVEIDPETGAVDVVAYVVADDVGTVINPVTLKGQIHGGVAQGVGQALMEQIVYDPDSGQLLTASFMDYALPRAD